MDRQREDTKDDAFSFRIDSDNLDLLRPLVDWAADRFGGVERLPRLYLVIDANAVYRELSFRLKEKKQRGARSALEEVLGSGIAIVFAPPYLLEEIEAHMTDWPKKMRTTEQRLRAEWEVYRKTLVFCTEMPVDSEAAKRLQARDPDDLPYVHLHDNLSAEMILTQDHDIRDSGVPTAGAAVVIDLRNYARHQSVFVTLSVGSVGGLMALLQLLMTLGRFITKSAMGIILTLAAGTVLWLIHRHLKAKAGSSAFTRAWHVFRDFVTRVLRMMKRSRDKATVQWRRVTSMFSGTKRRSLRQFIFAVCVRAGAALTLVDVVRRVLSDGHKTRAKRFRSQVRRCLRTDERFVQTPQGWQLQPWARAAQPRAS